MKGNCTRASSTSALLRLTKSNRLRRPNLRGRLQAADHGAVKEACRLAKLKEPLDSDAEPWCASMPRDNR